jgi:hypothetical protein
MNGSMNSLSTIELPLGGHWPSSLIRGGSSLHVVVADVAALAMMGMKVRAMLLNTF